MPDMLQTDRNYDQPSVYQIRIDGHLDQMWSTRFENMTLTYEGNHITLLTGEMIDQAMLYKILRQIRDLGLPLLSVTRLTSDDGS